MIHEVTAGMFEVQSFSNLGIFYTVNLEANTCTCPAFTHGSRRSCKHLTAVRKAAQAGRENVNDTEQGGGLRC